MNRKRVQSLAGKIIHITKACRPARLFMALILAYLCAHPQGYTPISQGARADICWFIEFLLTYNSVSTMPHPTPMYIIEADSCLIGGGALGNGFCYTYAYPEEMTDAHHINQLPRHRPDLRQTQASRSDHTDKMR